MRSISMDEFLTLENISVVDVREEDEYASGHIPNSQLIPLSNFAQELNKLDKKETHYLICRTGSRSLYAAQFASEKGYDVVNVMGGMSAYRGEVAYEV